MGAANDLDAFADELASASKSLLEWSKRLEAASARALDAARAIRGQAPLPAKTLIREAPAEAQLWVAKLPWHCSCGMINGSVSDTCWRCGVVAPK
jgi:hypothetical protein